MKVGEMDKCLIYGAGEIDGLDFEELADGTEPEFAESVLNYVNRTSGVEGAALVQKHFARENPAIHTLFTEVYVKTGQAYRIFSYTHYPSEPHLNGMTDNYIPAHQAALMTSLPFWTNPLLAPGTAEVTAVLKEKQSRMLQALAASYEKPPEQVAAIAIEHLYRLYESCQQNDGSTLYVEPLIKKLAFH